MKLEQMELTPRQAAVHRRLRDDLEYFCRKALKIKTKDGHLLPFVWNRAQRYIHERLEEQLEATGMVRALILKGRQQGCCYTPDMRVFTADYRWVPIGEVEPGLRVMAFDEEPVGVTLIGRKMSRKLRTAVVEAVVKLEKPVFKVTLDTGHSVKVTGEHRHLCRQRGGVLQVWRTVSDTKVGDYIRLITRPPWDQDPSYEDGWFGGLLDGEGSSRGHGSQRLSVHQREGEVLQRAKAWLVDNKVPHSTVVDSRVMPGLRSKEVFRYDIHRMPYIAEVISKTRPSRFLKEGIFDGQELPGKAVVDPKDLPPWGRVVSIEPLGVQEVIDLQTSEKTFVCEGLASHNSTYVGGRYYGKSTWAGYKSVYILSHEGESTRTLLGKVQTYWENCPEVIRPEVEIGNRNEFQFNNGSTYRVGTAGAKNTGRSQTNQFLHGSEVAYYDNTESISSGVLQTVADVPGTEIILESTANGIGDYFHTACMDALSGKGKYILIFVPWFWQEEYTAKVPMGWDFTDYEMELKELYNLTYGQLYWRYLKILELKSERLFRQEYPFTVMEAFQASGSSLIAPEHVQRARKSTVKDPGRPLILGVDPGRLGDRTVLALRQGREFLDIIKYNEMESTTRLAGIIARLIDRRKISKVFIDVALGHGTIDTLNDLGYASIVQGVHFGESAEDPKKFLNKRVEMAFGLRDWLMEGDCSIPDDEEVEADLLCVPDFKQNSRNVILLEPKDKIKEVYKKSPDIFDAMMLTFAYPVYQEMRPQGQILQTHNTKKGSSLKTLQRVRSIQAGVEEDNVAWGPEEPVISPRYQAYRRR